MIRDPGWVGFTHQGWCCPPLSRPPDGLHPGGVAHLVRATLTLTEVRATLTDMTRPRISPPGASRLQTLCCSFCTKDKDAVAKLIAGPGVYICNECVGLCDLILAEEPAPGFGSWNEQPDDEMLASLTRIQSAVSQADAAVHDHVAVLRERGISWTRIGEALGVSKQAAWERFSGED